jgi:ornithine carbamoyltransferase
MVAVADSLKGRSFTRVADWSRNELLQVLDLADELKRLQHAGEEHRLLPGRTLGMIFQKPSTRTRVSFEVGIYQLGGTGLYLSAGDLQLGRGETIKDTAVVLSRYLDAIMIRTFAQSDVEELAANASIPIINGLTDSSHPCQALADVMTIRERFGHLEGLKVVYLGDGNNVCASLMVASAKLGMDFVAATPPGYRPEDEPVRIARESGGSSSWSTIHALQSRAPTSSTPTCGPRWDGRRSARGGSTISRATASTPSSWPAPATTRSSCTACRRTTARRSRRTFSTGRSLRSGTKRRIASTRRRR